MKPLISFPLLADSAPILRAKIKDIISIIIVPMNCIPTINADINHNNNILCSLRDKCCYNWSKKQGLRWTIQIMNN